MPIGSIILQPAADSINAAYRPIVFQVTATATAGGVPPVVYCDIYVNTIYYKSLQKTQSNGGFYQFDIQDAAQEVLKSFMAPNGGIAIVPANTVFGTVSCQFRSSGYDVDNFITPEGTPPVQGTGSIPPTAGSGGTDSNSFYIVNATLQHDQNQDLASHLAAYKNGTWSADTWPLTHRPNNYCIADAASDYFPIVTTGNDPSCINIAYTNKDGITGAASDCGLVTSCPMVPGISVASGGDNGDGTQTIEVSWGFPDPVLTTVTIQYRVSGGGAFTNHVIGANAMDFFITLPLGSYDFRLQANGACNTSTSGITTVGVDPPDCVPVTGTLSMPDGITSTPYSYSMPLSGTDPFSISAITKPSWMTIALSGSNVNFTGTPALGDAGTTIPIAFTIDNACRSVDFNDNIDVLVLQKTFTLSVTFGISPQFVAEFNTPVDVDVTVNTIFADGYTSSTCALPVAQSMTANNFTVPAGTYANSKTGTPGTGWTSLNSYTVYAVFITVAGGFAGAVFPGDVITMGSYSVTIVFTGC